MSDDCDHSITRALQTSDLLDRCRDLLAKKQVAEAVNTARQIAQMSPLMKEELAKVLFDTANAFLQANDIQPAIDLLSSATELDPYNVNMLLQLAYCYEKHGVDRAAMGYYFRAVQLDPYNMQAIKRLIAGCIKSEEWAQAKAAMELAIRVEPSPDLHLQLGQILMQLHDRIGAAEAFQTCIRIDPNGAFAQKARLLMEELSA